jgi:signal transduction histidine kinase
MNDQCASALRPPAGFIRMNSGEANPDFSSTGPDAGLPETHQRASWALPDHLRLWPVWLRGQELGKDKGQRDEFMTVFSHELRNSLGAIRSATWILRAEASAGSTAVKARQVIERQVAQMTRLVEDLLDMSRVRRGQLTLHCERVDLRAITADAARTVAFIMQERNHRLTTALPDGPVWLHADAGRLEQVIVNLLLNAAKYTEPGGNIQLDVTGEPGEAILRIRDDGIGIESKALPLVFDLFSQANPSSRDAKGGLGIGLALARNLVEHHGGRISAASAGLGRGSEFTIRLPMIAA